MQLQIALQRQPASGHGAVNGTSLASSALSAKYFPTSKFFLIGSLVIFQELACSNWTATQCFDEELSISSSLKLELDHCTVALPCLKSVGIVHLNCLASAKRAWQLSFDAVFWNRFAPALLCSAHLPPCQSAQHRVFRRTLTAVFATRTANSKCTMTMIYV